MTNGPYDVVPEPYRGREQTYIKHRVLATYIDSWAQKMASLATYAKNGRVRLWYIDCFSGPWQSKDQALEDTSICLGLNAISEAAKFWRSKNLNIEIGAIFVEKDPTAYSKLEGYLDSRKADLPGVVIKPLKGEFGTHVETIDKLIGRDPAFLFIDPLGWKGVAMKYIAPLAKKPFRDVMINFMYDHVNRFKDAGNSESAERELIEFFGAEYEHGLDEERTMRFYESQLKEKCGLKYAASLVVQDPDRDRTKFRLVLGAHDDAAIILFRHVEKKILAGEEPVIREGLKENKRFERTANLPLFATPQPDPFHNYTARQQRGLYRLSDIIDPLLEKGPVPYARIRGPLLEQIHITDVDLRQILWKMTKDGKLLVSGTTGRERTLNENHILSKPSLKK